MPDDTKLMQIERGIDRGIDRGIANQLPVSRNAGGTFTVAPQSMGELLEFAKLMAVSSFCVRPAFRGNPGACLAVALQAFRCGGDPFAWANKAYITKNKAGEEQIAYEAQLVHAIVNSSPVLQRRLRPVYEGDGQTRKCRVVGFVKGEDEALEYESPPIGKIAVKNSPLWQADPDQQLWYYSTRAWARRHVPEILLGIYAPEEFTGETIDLTPEPEPRREDYVREARQVEQPREPEFELIDLDGEVISFRGNRAWLAFRALIDEAEQRGIRALDGMWEDNGPTLEALSAEGFTVAELVGAYDEARQRLREKQAASRASAGDGAGRDQRPGQATGRRPTAEATPAPSDAIGAPQASESAAPSDKPSQAEQASSAPPPAAAQAKSPEPADDDRFPGDLPAGERLVPRHSPGAGAEPAAVGQSPSLGIRAGAPHAEAAAAESNGRTAGSIPATGATSEAQGDRPSMLIPMVVANGKANPRAWAMAMFLPKLKRQTDPNSLAFLLGDNEANIELCRKPGALHRDDLNEFEKAIKEQWRLVENGAG